MKNFTWDLINVRLGTTGAGANSNVIANSGIKIVSTTATQFYSVYNITSRPWSAAVATYKSIITDGSGCITFGSCTVAGQLDPGSGGRLRYCDGTNWRMLVE